MIRRGVRFSSEKRQCYFVRTERHGFYQSHAELDSIEDVLDFDVAALAEHRSVPDTVKRPQPLFLVCTHGRHDACCSIKGNFVSRIACAQDDMDAWECSHIGGDRFAANLVCFPHGVYYGRVGSPDVLGLMNAYNQGQISLDHYRGRCCYPFEVQAAEYFVRREASITAVDDLTLIQASRSGDRVTASFTLKDQQRANVEIEVTEAGRYRLTCTSERAEPVPRYELVSCALSSI